MLHLTHLPCNDPERIDVPSFCTFCPNKPEALRVNQLGGSAVEKSIDFRPWAGGWSRNCSKAGKADMPATVNEDVCLDNREPMTEGGKRMVRTILRFP